MFAALANAVEYIRPDLNNRRCPECHGTALWPEPLTLSLSTATWTLLISSCLILAPQRTLKCTFHYSLFNSHYCLGSLVSPLDSSPIGQLKDSSVSFPSPPLLPPLSLLSPSSHGPCPPPTPPLFLAATPGNYKLVHNNNS